MTQYERPQLNRTQKKLLIAFILGVIAISLFLFQAVTYSARQKEIRESVKSATPATTPESGEGSSTTSGEAPSVAPEEREGSASEPTQVK